MHFRFECCEDCKSSNMFLWGIWTVQRRRCPPAGHAICVARCVASQWRWWGRQMEQLIALCACICGIHIWYVTVWAVCISYLKETSRQGRHISTCMSGDSWPSTAQPSPTKRQLPICSADLASWKFVNLGTLPNSPPISESQMDSQCLQTGVPSLGPFFWMRIPRWWNSAFVWVLYVHSVVSFLPRWKLQADFCHGHVLQTGAEHCITQCVE